VAWWNVENLFDTVDDPNKNDNEFLPKGDKLWTEERLNVKFKKLAEVIKTMNNGNGPDVLGVCEVENESVLKRFIDEELKDMNYKTVYYESGDQRGIDVGIMYRASILEVTDSKKHTVPLEGGATRDIIETSFKIGSAKFTVFGNHWPSRRGGKEKSEPKRILAAQTLRSAVDKILKNEPDADIIMFGDFNDEPDDISITDHLKATGNKDKFLQSSDFLFNAMWDVKKEGLGTYNFQGGWDLIDHFIFSKGLFDEKGLKFQKSEILSFDFLRKYDKKKKTKFKPFSTFDGDDYQGGYSDHFPIRAEFEVKQ
jgi:predicted extracellular nuclease